MPPRHPRSSARPDLRHRARSTRLHRTVGGLLALLAAEAVITEPRPTAISCEAGYIATATLGLEEKHSCAESCDAPLLVSIVRQRCLARAGRARAQPDPGAGDVGWPRPPPRPHRDHPADPDRRPGSAGALSPQAAPATTRALALADSAHLVPPPHRRHPDAHLNPIPTPPTTMDLGQAGRPAGQTRPEPAGRPPTPHKISKLIIHSWPVDPG